MAIVTMLATAVGPALSVFRSSSLTQSGNQLVDMTTLARQIAVNKNTITALIIVLKDTASMQKVDREAVAILEYDPLQKAWKKIGAWERLSESVDVLDYAGTNPNGDPAAANQIAPVSLILDGKQVDQGQSAYMYTSLVFYPDGRLSGGSGTRSIGLVFASGSQTGNSYKFVVNNDTAAIRIFRP